MKIKLFAFSLFCFFSISLSAQEVLTVNITKRMQDDKISRSLAILPVYVFKTIEVEPFTLFGIDEDEKEEQNPLIIQKMPDMNGMRDTGYTYIYFSGANTEINQGYCLTLIGNFKRSRKTIYFFVDRNNNLDFTDDGKPDSLTYMDESFILTLKNQTNKNAEHKIQLSRIEYGKNIAYKNLLTEHFAKHSGKKVFSDINYCYREQRLNTIGGEYKSGEDSFMIAFKDMNNDGIFNESCMDMFYIGAVGEEIHTEEMSLILPNIEDVYFEWNNKRYQLKSIVPNGSEMRFVQEQNPILTKKLEIDKKIPKFSFVSIENQKVDIKKFKKKPSFIFFWNEETITNEDTMYLNKLHQDYSNDLNIIALNHGDNQRDVRKYHYYEQIKWPIGFSSYQIGKMFFLENSKKGFLTGKRLKLKKEEVSPKQLYEFLQSSDT